MIFKSLETQINQLKDIKISQSTNLKTWVNRETSQIDNEIPRNSSFRSRA